MTHLWKKSNYMKLWYISSLPSHFDDSMTYGGSFDFWNAMCNFDELHDVSSSSNCKIENSFLREMWRFSLLELTIFYPIQFKIFDGKELLCFLWLQFRSVQIRQNLIFPWENRFLIEIQIFRAFILGSLIESYSKGLFSSYMQTISNATLIDGAW